MYKTLKINAKNIIETLITVKRVKSQFFCDIFVVFYTKPECSEELDAQNTPNITNYKYKTIFSVFCNTETWKLQAFMKPPTFHKNFIIFL